MNNQQEINSQNAEFEKKFKIRIEFLKFVFVVNFYIIFMVIEFFIILEMFL